MGLRISAAVAALAALVSCGPLNEGNVSKGFLAVVQSKLSGAPDATPPAPPLTRAQADANPGAFMLVSAYGGASLASMVIASTNGNRQTWISADSVTVTTDNGIIVATRGFPRDLIAAEVGSVVQALVSSGGTATRVHETINDLDQISTEVLQCSIVLDGRETITVVEKSSLTSRFKESCRGESVAFTNTYWITDQGRMIRSSQAVAPDTGFLVLDRP